MEDQDYEDDEMSHASLSSGLSPRESRPRTRPWDLAEGYQVHFTLMHCHMLCLGKVMLYRASCKKSLLDDEAQDQAQQLSQELPTIKQCSSGS